MSETYYSDVRKCEHCHNTAAMIIIAMEQDTESFADHSDMSSDEWHEGFSYEILKCQSCKQVILRRLHLNSRRSLYPTGETILYPQVNSSLIGVPPSVQKAFDSAQKVRLVDPNSYAVQLRRMLEFICKDQSASGNNLAKKLQDLSTRNLIPDKLSEIAKHLKDFGNVGAHADDFDITEEEIPILDSLARAVAEYIYTAPALAKQAEERYRELNEGKDK